MLPSSTVLISSFPALFIPPYLPSFALLLFHFRSSSPICTQTSVPSTQAYSVFRLYLRPLRCVPLLFYIENCRLNATSSSFSAPASCRHQGQDNHWVTPYPVRKYIANYGTGRSGCLQCRQLELMRHERNACGSATNSEILVLPLWVPGFKGGHTVVVEPCSPNGVSAYARKCHWFAASKRLCTNPRWGTSLHVCLTLEIGPRTTSIGACSSGHFKTFADWPTLLSRRMTSGSRSALETQERTRIRWLH